MKIGVNWRLFKHNQPTGVQNYMINLYDWLAEVDKAHDYIKLCLDLPDNLLLDGVHDNFLIKELIKKEKLDIYHSPAITLPLGKKTCSYVATIHDLAFKALPDVGNKLFLKYYDFTVHNALDKADVIIADSIFTKFELKKYYSIANTKKIEIVPLGVDKYFFEQESKKYLQKIKKKYKLEQTKVVYTNSAHSQRKNVQILIKLFDNPHAFKDTTLVITGCINKKVINQKENADNILILEHIPKREIRALYQLSNIFIYPSIYEGFGIPILEAMASKSLLLSSNIPPLKEIIPWEKLLFDPTNLNQIKEKIKYYLDISEKEKNNIVNLYPQILNNYQWKKVATQTLDIFNKI